MKIVSELYARIDALSNVADILHQAGEDRAAFLVAREALRLIEPHSTSRARELLVEHGNDKVAAIIAYRKEFEVGLVEAKNAIESVMDKSK